MKTSTCAPAAPTTSKPSRAAALRRPDAAPAISWLAPTTARQRLLAYFRAFGIVDPAALDRLADMILQDLGSGDGEEADCAAAAIEEAKRRVDAWFRDLLEPEDLAGRTAAAVGRAAFLASGAGARWPGLLLVEGDLPEGFVAALRSALPRSTPTAARCQMAEQPFEFLSLSLHLRPRPAETYLSALFASFVFLTSPGLV